MRLKEISSGSQNGNCSYLFLDKDELILFDLGISFKRLNNYFKENENLDLRKDKLDILLLITHEHTDHWNKDCYKGLIKNKQLDIKIVLPTEDMSFLWKSTSIDSKRLKHGETFTNFFVVDCNYGYLTDCDGDQIIHILTFKEAYNLLELFIEANYDEAYLTYQEQINTANGYDVSSGFNRHLSIQESNQLVTALMPKEHHQIHKSSRFYEVNICHNKGD